MITYEVVYKNLSEEYKKSIYNLWSGVLPDHVKDQRIDQVFAVMKDDDKIIGVSTVYPAILIDELLYYNMRVFVHPRNRNRLISRKNVNFIQLAKTVLANYSNEPNTIRGIVLRLENKKITAKFMKSFGLNYYSSKDHGSFWYHNFDGSLINV